jgi:hypothetical protein
MSGISDSNSGCRFSLPFTGWHNSNIFVDDLSNSHYEIFPAISQFLIPAKT